MQLCAAQGVSEELAWSVLLGAVVPLDMMMAAYIGCMTSRRGGGPTGGSGESWQDLVEELAEAGIKHTPEDIVRIARHEDGRIIFLERGTARSGLAHIVGHAGDFANQGITESQIPDLVMNAVLRGNVVGTQGADRQIYEHVFNGQTYRTAVQVGDNGYIAGANPQPRP
jgi:hypothetical protein